MLESTTTKPKKNARPTEYPASAAMPATAAMVSPDWSVPPRKKARRICRRRSSENSAPIRKSRKMTPISAESSTCPGSEMKPSPVGPTSTPVSSSPMTGGMRSR